MSEWNFITLKEAGVQLIDCVHNTPEAKDSGYYYIAIPQMKDGRIDPTDARLISEEDFKKWTIKANPQKWDIVLSRRCNPGVTSVVTGEFEFALGQNLVLLRSDGTKIYPPFLKWMVNSQYWWKEISKFLNVGAVFESLRCADVPNFKLPVPSVEIQKEISKTLENLDQKITLLRQQNQDLEELAQSLFKRWFVEFEFPIEVKGKKEKVIDCDDEENLLPITSNFLTYKSSGGKMVESELGEIPEGWKLRTLGDLAINYSNKRIPLSSKDRSDRKGIYPYYGASGIVDYIDDFIFEGCHILFSEDGENLRSRNSPIVFLVDGKFWVNNHAHILKGKESYLFYFIYLFLLKANIDPIITGAVQPKVNKANLHSLEVLLPNTEILKDFDKVVRKIFEKLSNNKYEIQTLTQLRDTLLPKLMSGEISVKY